MKYKEKYKFEEVGEIIEGTTLLVCDDNMNCIYCKEPTNFVDFCSHARICSDECCNEFWNMCK